ncbi:MAG: hypothetical protein M3456_14675 [Actinomycetota bacterium]|nr:hypothetical protein [Actinomycetota bacterium]
MDHSAMDHGIIGLVVGAGAVVAGLAYLVAKLWHRSDRDPAREQPGTRGVSAARQAGRDVC